MFIHIGKTGGMSCSHYLLRNLQRPVLNCHREARQECEKLALRDVTPVTSVNRHCTLAAAQQLLATQFGRSIEQLIRIVAVFRHPYSLEYSWYQHLRKPRKRKRRESQRALLALAAGDFETFVRKSDHHRPGLSQEKYLMIDGVMPENVKIVRFESLESDFPASVAPFLNGGVAPGKGTNSNTAATSNTATTELRFPRVNSSHYDRPAAQVLSPAAREAIQEKHAYLFQSGFYEP